MEGRDSGLDFDVVDRARSLGDLLSLLFALAHAWKPKEIADALNSFDPSIDIDANAIGRWLRNERRPSKPHMQVMIRFFQSEGLIGVPLASDRVFIRIAAHLAGLPRAFQGPAPIIERAPRSAGPVPVDAERFKALIARLDAERAHALEMDLASPSPDWERLDPTWRGEAEPKGLPPVRMAMPEPLPHQRPVAQPEKPPSFFRRWFYHFWND